jgi:hypothetical protein
MPIPTLDFKIAALKCLAEQGLTVNDAISRLLGLSRGAAIAFKDGEGVQYSYHILGQSVNFELWARRSAEPIAYEIGFMSDH